MKKWLIVLIILVSTLVIFANSITSFIIRTAINLNGGECYKVDLFWRPTALHIKELDCTLDSARQNIVMQVSDAEVKINFAKIRYKVLVQDVHIDLKVKQKQDAKKVEDRAVKPIILELPMCDRISVDNLQLNVFIDNYKISSKQNLNVTLVDETILATTSGTLKVIKDNQLLASLELVANVQLENEKIKYNIKLSHDSLSISKKILNKPLTIEKGSYKLNGYISNDNNLTVDVDIKHLNMDELLLSNISSQSDISIGQKYIKTNNKIIIKSASKGVSIEDFVLEFASNHTNKKAFFTITRGDFVLGGGKVSLHPTELSLYDSKDLKLNIEKVKMNAVAEQLELQDLRIGGRLSGKLLLNYQPYKIKIISGSLANISDGKISFAPKDADVLSKIENYTKLPSKLWQDFDYNLLDVNVAEQGDKNIIKLKLIGSNHRVFKNRKIHVNINLNLPIYSLLQSWWLGDEVSQRVLDSLLPISGQ